MKTITKSTTETDILRNKMDEYISANKTVKSEVSITTTIETDVLRSKMDKYVVKNIDKFIAPKFRMNQDVIRLAREWRKTNVELYKINDRIEVMEEELTEMERREELVRLDKMMEEEMEEEARRDGLNTIKERNPRLIEHHNWDELYTWEYEGSDTY